ncbi:hypothetical protein HN51_040635 [Arachis hypogaea]
MQEGRISFSGQVQNYQNTVSQVVNILGSEDSAANYLSKCIYSIGLGSNDYLNNYFMPQFYSRSRVCITMEQGKWCCLGINDANQIFNNKLKSLVDQLNTQLPDARFIYINSYGIFQDIISNLSAYGFSVTNAGCCGVGRNNGQITCLPMQTPCENRREHLFWDAFHPTEAGNAYFSRNFA